MRFLSQALLLTFITLTTAQALEYAGVLIASKGPALHLRDHVTGKTFELTSESQIVDTVLQKLKTKDYVSFEGTGTVSKNSVQVDSINFVGLHDLFGVWQADDRYCYAFLSFTEFVIYPSKNSTCGKYTGAGTKYAYTINPTEYNNWVLLLSSDHANYVADLTLKSATSAEISLYDSNTGYILKVIKLRK